MDGKLSEFKINFKVGLVNTHRMLDSILYWKNEHCPLNCFQGPRGGVADLNIQRILRGGKQGTC